MMSSYIKEKSDSIISVFSWILFLSCSSGLVLLGYECVKKFLEKPQAVEISNVQQYEVDIPDFTFCPTGIQGDFPPTLNMTNLNKCGLDMKNIVEDGIFVGSGGHECKDPKTLWEFISLKIDDFGIKRIAFSYVNTKVEDVITAEEHSKNWNKEIILEWNGGQYHYKTCFSLSIPKKNHSLRLFSIETDPRVSFITYIHHAGMLIQVYPRLSSQYGQTFSDGDGTAIDVKYSQFITLNDNFGKPCESDKSFSLSSYYMTKTDEVNQN